MILLVGMLTSFRTYFFALINYHLIFIIASAIKDAQTWGNTALGTRPLKEKD
jgi:hypothetical protein